MIERSATGDSIDTEGTAYGSGESWYRHLFETAQNGVAITTPDGEVLDGNPAALEMFGYTREELTKLQVEDLYAYPRQRRELVRRIEEDGSVSDFEARMTRKDGSELLCSLAVSARRAPSGRIVAYQTIIRDITEERRLQREMFTVMEEQKRQIGHDLHDVLSSLLTGIALACDALAQKCENGQPVDAEDLEMIADQARQGVEQTRSICRGLHPVPLEENGLEYALHALLENIEQFLDVALEVSTGGLDRDIPDEVAMHLYRIAQEAVNNAVRHSSATEVSVTLSADVDNFVLRITDDGQGIPAPENRPDGIGLRSMAYRSRLIGANFDVSRGEDSGTTVAVRVPTDLLAG